MTKQRSNKQIWIMLLMTNFTKSLKTLVILTLFFCAPIAHAVTCNITSTGFATAYAPTGIVPNVTQGSFTVTCSSNTGFDPATVDFDVAVNNGQNNAGGNNAQNGGNANRIAYDTYRNNGCSTLWASAAASRFTGTGTLPFTTTINYWGCITVANQNEIAGTYTDTVTMTLRYDNFFGITSTATNTFPVAVTNPASCSITSVSNVAFGTYLAFRTTPLNAPNATVTLNCTSQLPYSLALDATTGVVSGLNYSLSLSAANSRGTGPGQTHTITGTMPANQAGTCASGSCTGSQQRTLTITY